MPIPKKLERTIKKFAKKDSKIAKKFFPYDTVKGDLKLYILAINGTDREYDLLGIVDDWGAEPKPWLNKTAFSVSTVRNDFGLDRNSNETFFEVVKRATHFAKYGELWRIKEGDSVQIYQFHWGYEVLGELEVQNKFTLAMTEPEVEPEVEPEP